MPKKPFAVRMRIAAQFQEYKRLAAKRRELFLRDLREKLAEDKAKREAA